MANAQNNINPIVNPVQASGVSTYYVRFTKNGICPNVGTITLTIKTPKKSTILVDKTICANQKTTLDAGAGFDAYLWNTGATTQEITNVTAGNYWVQLTFNGCSYQQSVQVVTSPLPEITAIDIKNKTVTITVVGGVPPYQYSLDGVQWQSSNVFDNIEWGNYTIFVKDSLNCDIIRRPFTIINLINAITPNGDGDNETLDYSSLLQKQEPYLEIFDRYGAAIFKGNAGNRFVWDGTVYGRPVPTATYWYIVSWKEFGGNTRVQYHSWLLVKNRNDNYFKGK
jgi:gliding motility-associated-like protein